MRLAEALKISKGEVIAFTGAGGKTTAMFALARELSSKGNKIVVTTTTKIMPPKPEESPFLIVEKEARRLLLLLEEGLQKYNLVTLGTLIQSDGKLVGIQPEWVELIQEVKEVRNILVEADGAAGKPFKAPREYEPVIPHPCHLVVPMVGIDALGKALQEENVHRVERITALTSLKPGDIITPEAIALVILHPQGNIKGTPKGARIIPLINKVDDSEKLDSARKLASLLIKQGAKRVVLAHAAFEPEVVEVIDSSKEESPMEELDLIVEVNELFEPFYPYVARQIAGVYARKGGFALEIGPYAPGISIWLAQLNPELKITVGDSTPGIQEFFRQKIKKAGLEERIKIRELDKARLPFPEGTFDLVYFRGALFFWEEEEKIIQEAYRVLKKEGVALLGGGFGAEAPDELINSLLDRSRELNRRLGKKVLSESELQKILKEANLVSEIEIDRRHGLWVIFRKK